MRFNTDKAVVPQPNLQTGIVSIPTQNTYINLELQELTDYGGEVEAHNDPIQQRPQHMDNLNRSIQSQAPKVGSQDNSGQRSTQQRRTNQDSLKNQIGYQHDTLNRSGIDLTLPIPANPNIGNVDVLNISGVAV